MGLGRRPEAAAAVVCASLGRDARTPAPGKPRSVPRPQSFRQRQCPQPSVAFHRSRIGTAALRAAPHGILPFLFFCLKPTFLVNLLRLGEARSAKGNMDRCTGICADLPRLLNFGDALRIYDVCSVTVSVRPVKRPPRASGLLLASEPPCALGRYQ